jgi:hypothetical protein
LLPKAVCQAARPEGWQQCLPIRCLDGVRRLERQQGNVAACDEQRDLVLFRLAPPAPPAADIALLASTNECYGIASAVKCARDSWQRLPGRKQSERQKKAKKPAPNPVLRREAVLELAQIVRKTRSRQSGKLCVA